MCLVPMEAREECQIPWNWNSRWLRGTTWVMGTEPKSSARAAGALHCWAFSPAQFFWVCSQFCYFLDWLISWKGVVCNKDLIWLETMLNRCFLWIYIFNCWHTTFYFHCFYWTYTNIYSKDNFDHNICNEQPLHIFYKANSIFISMHILDIIFWRLILFFFLNQNSAK